jgi:hypothetical protein
MNKKLNPKRNVVGVRLNDADYAWVEKIVEIDHRRAKESGKKSTTNKSTVVETCVTKMRKSYERKYS